MEQYAESLGGAVEVPTSTTIPLVGFTVAAGNGVLGPFDVPIAWTALTLTLDIASLLSPLWLTLEYAPDGVTWRHLATLDFTGPAVLHGAPNTTADMRLTLGSPAPGAIPKIRGTVTNTGLAWVSNGGSLVVS